jgi:8-oxo-dGTP diphosphatase
MPDPDLVFCPRCGERLEWRGVEYPDVRHPVCATCGFILWQNVKPTVEALIVRNEGANPEVLLGRRIASLPDEQWDVPGGFLNAGDRIEPALVRECRREMGIEVAVGDLLGAFESVFYDIPIVMLIYVCRVVSGTPVPRDYIDEVRWFRLDGLPEVAFEAVSSALATLRGKIGGEAAGGT